MWRSTFVLVSGNLKSDPEKNMAGNTPVTNVSVNTQCFSRGSSSIVPWRVAFWEGCCAQKLADMKQGARVMILCKIQPPWIFESKGEPQALLKADAVYILGKDDVKPFLTYITSSLLYLLRTVIMGFSPGGLQGLALGVFWGRCMYKDWQGSKIFLLVVCFLGGCFLWRGFQGSTLDIKGLMEQLFSIPFLSVGLVWVLARRGEQQQEETV